jgi:hypothetical protein
VKYEDRHTKKLVWLPGKITDVTPRGNQVASFRMIIVEENHYDKTTLKPGVCACVLKGSDTGILAPTSKFALEGI